MPNFNNIDLKKWKESDVWTDSLWIIDERDNSGKHEGFYHGNFVPQVPRQIIKKYSKIGDTVLDLFLGSGTTAYEAETHKRNFIGVDILSNMVEYVSLKLDKHDKYFYELLAGDSMSEQTEREIKDLLTKHKRKLVQLVILHPPYADIIKFSDKANDLSNAKSLKEFISMFSRVVRTAYNLLEKDRYLAIVIGDAYKNSEWIPLGFYCMRAAQKNGFKLKSIVVKNMSGNRGKQNKEGIWKYRSLANDYYVFKHEYIIILKKVDKI
jgi:DNA modification methylase